MQVRSRVGVPLLGVVVRGDEVGYETTLLRGDCMDAGRTFGEISIDNREGVFLEVEDMGETGLQRLLSREVAGLGGRLPMGQKEEAAEARKEDAGYSAVNLWV